MNLRRVILVVVMLLAVTGLGLTGCSSTGGSSSEETESGGVGCVHDPNAPNCD
jgi:hypothetical protein